MPIIRDISSPGEEGQFSLLTLEGSGSSSLTSLSWVGGSLGCLQWAELGLNSQGLGGFPF